MKGRIALSIVLWVFQGFLAILFLTHGVSNFEKTPAQLAQHYPLSASFMLFIGAMEVLGGIGLVLPSLLRIKPVLTPVAACGLVLIMIGAIVVRLPKGIEALGPLLFGSIAAFVAYGRLRLRPIKPREAASHETR